MSNYTFENTGNGVVTRYTHPTFGKVVTISEGKWDAYIAKVKAEAWDEGNATPRELEPLDGHTFTAVNPYREVSK